jgi:hypothetical protein
MPNGEDEGQPPEDTGEEQPSEEQPSEEQPSEEQVLSGEVEPASQPDEGVTPQEPDAGVPTQEELDAMEQALAEAPKRAMGPEDEIETALAEADTTDGNPSEIDPTSVA